MKWTQRKFDDLLDTSGRKHERIRPWLGPLSYHDLSGINFQSCSLVGAALTNANLCASDLRLVDLSGADLRNANLTGARLDGAHLYETDLSGATGLLGPIEYLAANFERTPEGYIVYKSFGEYHPTPERWTISPGSVIEEVVNPDRTTACGCGVNVGTLEWVKKHCVYDVWKCLIRWEWLPGVIVPFNTDGKIRASRVELLHTVSV